MCKSPQQPYATLLMKDMSRDKTNGVPFIWAMENVFQWIPCRRSSFKIKACKWNSIPALEEGARVLQPGELRDLSAAARTSLSTDILCLEEETLIRHVLTAGGGGRGGGGAVARGYSLCPRFSTPSECLLFTYLFLQINPEAPRTVEFH